MSTEPLTPNTFDANSADVGGERYLKSQIQELRERFGSESTKHKKLFRRFRYAIFALTACSSALAGLALAFPTIQTGTTIAIIATTAAIGVATSVEGLRKPHELWIRERTTFYELTDLQREMTYRADPALMDKHFARLQSILGSSREKWSQDVGLTQPAGPPVSPGKDALS
jgi:hypothetical protein